MRIELDQFVDFCNTCANKAPKWRKRLARYVEVWNAAHAFMRPGETVTVRPRSGLGVNAITSPIQAIKAVLAASGLGLKESKDLVDGLRTGVTGSVKCHDEPAAAVLREWFRQNEPGVEVSQ